MIARPSTKAPDGAVLWSGPSEYDGAPIVVIATGIRGTSSNPKTGRMIQTWILRSDVHPVEALQTGADRSICGTCPHRPDADGRRSCYVNPMGPSAIWRKYRADGYPHASLADMCQWIEGRRIRFGAYGDPVAAPLDLWQSMAGAADGWTGYTHGWRSCDPRFRHYLMASVDHPGEASVAQYMGWRTFRVRSASEPPMYGAELDCPASEESGKRTTCAACGLCSGAYALRDNPPRSISIVAHGPGKRHAERRATLTIGGAAV